MRLTKRHFISNIAACLLVVLIIGGMTAVAAKQTLREPDNPIADEREPSSHMLLSSSSTSGIGIADGVLSNIKKAEIYNDASQNKEDNQTERNKPGEAVEEKQTEDEAQTGGDYNKGKEKEGTIPATISDGNTNTVYFTTSIKDGSTISQRDYSFTITHKIKELKVKELKVYVNDILQLQFKGSVLLSEGKNVIKVSVQYLNEKNELISVYKDYTLYVNTGDIVITTDLCNQTVDTPDFSFKAKAVLNGTEIPLNVKLNNKSINSNNGSFNVKLEEGDNQITLYADSDGRNAKESYTVTYKPPDTLTIRTSVKNETVNESIYTFTARILGGTPKSKLTVVVNSKTITPSSEGYTVQLNIGTNTIRLKATDMVDGQNVTVSDIYYVKYVPKTTEETSPKIEKINLTDGMNITGSTYTLDITPVDYQGKSIYYNGITVKLNGTVINYRWASGGTTSYLLSLSYGKNIIDIRITDNDGQYRDYSYSVNCKQVEANQPIGKATISLQASTLGLGYIIEPVTVDIYEGEPASYVVVRLLEKYGIKASYAGTLDTGFYLSRISKKGIGLGVQIPQDLIEAIDNDGLEWKEQHYDDSIGEFDYCQGSGWMYSVNGYYPNHGLSECYLKDGDVVRIRFTLAYGKDIGGYSSSGGDESENYYKEW